MKFNDLKLDDPTVQSVVSFVKEPMKGNFIVINEVVPMVNEKGIIIDKAAQETLQRISNENGLLVTHSNCETVVVDDKVIIAMGNTPTMSKVVGTNTLIEGLEPKVVEAFNNKEGRFETEQSRQMFYKKFVVMGFMVHSVVCTVNK